MKKLIPGIFALLLFNCLGHASPVDTVRFGVFGKVAIYRPTEAVNAVVLFVSGDGGWNSGVVDMAINIVRQGALVAGIDIRQYYKGLTKLTSNCYYPAGDFEELSLMLQKKYKFAKYLKPILVGYSSGATLVYGILAQAPANTFNGAISLGFCPDIEINKPLCNGAGLKQHTLKEGKSFYLEASDKMTAPFFVLHGLQDQVCPFAATQQYMKSVTKGQLIELPKAGHGFSIKSSWLPQFIKAYKSILATPSFAEQKMAQDTLFKIQSSEWLPKDFPIIPIPSAAKNTLPMVFLISGDGGWTSFDNSLGDSFAAKGMPVIGLDSQKYFWNAKTPEETATTISFVVQHFMQQWNRNEFILAGYSFGAGILPFVANRLPALIKESLVGVYCLSPDEKADFEIHISDMLNFGNSDDNFRVPEEIKKIIPLHPVCVFGNEEDGRLRTIFEEAGSKIITIPGNHHYNNNPLVAAEAIINDVKTHKKN